MANKAGWRFYRTFGNKTYQQYLSVGKLSIAKQEARKLRKKGYSVRIIPYKNLSILGGKVYVVFRSNQK